MDKLWPKMTMTLLRSTSRIRIIGAISFLLLMLTAPGFAQEFLREFPLRQQTKYFDFHFKQHTNQIAATARFADAFIEILNRDFFKANFEFPIRVLVLEDREKFQRFLREQLHITDPPGFGIYLPQLKMFVTYEDSGLGTFAHEITHPLVEHNFKDVPTWTVEGIPSFFEKFYGYWTNNTPIVYWGYHNPWRIQALGPDLVKLDLKALLATKDPQGQFHESDIRMISMFLWDQGKFPRFLKLLQARDKSGYNSYLEAAFDKHIDDIVPIWKNYLQEVADDRSQIMRYPASAILPNESTFKRFVAAAGISIESPPKIPHSARVNQAPAAPQEKITLHRAADTADTGNVKLPDLTMNGATIAAEKEIQVGKPIVLQARSPKNAFAAVFEDEGNTGYFYAIDPAHKPPIIDALHIYNVSAVADKNEPSKIQIIWSNDGQKAVLLINKYPHAVFDFAAKRGYCRTGYPAPSDIWPQPNHTWTDQALSLFGK